MSTPTRPADCTCPPDTPPNAYDADCLSCTAFVQHLRDLERSTYPRPAVPADDLIDHGPIILQLRRYADGTARLTTSGLTREQTMHVLTNALEHVRDYDDEWTTEPRVIT